MCCIFGFIDYHHSLTMKQKNRLLSTLATAAEARGTDATGVAYNSGGKLCIYKRPLPGHRMHFRVPQDAAVVMGHTRMATQGDARKNCNNHPFAGSVGDEPFALAHNGVLFNDDILQRSLSLPATPIETDSYVAVQLIEREGSLDFSSLRQMAEQVSGSFVFTVLDQQDSLYFVKGDNPLTVYHFPGNGLYVYASTEEILRRGLSKARFIRERPEKISTECGEILRIDKDGVISRSGFNNTKYSYWGYDPMFRFGAPSGRSIQEEWDTDDYWEELKSVASAFGYTPEAIDRLAAQGFTPEELEEWLYEFEGESRCVY